jgi:hypothetical protein
MNFSLAFGFGFGFDKVFETWHKSVEAENENEDNESQPVQKEVSKKNSPV